MLMNRTMLLFGLLAATFSGVCPADQTAKPHVLAQKLTRSAALNLARAAAQKHGYDMSKYVLDTFGGSGKLNASGTEWLFGFACSPPETRPPGCDVLVVVNRSTGETKVIPGM